MDPLLSPWTSAVGGTPAALRAGQDLLARYEEPHRRYHDRRHLAEVLAALRVLSPDALLPVPVVCAAYFHDAVHDGAPDDEERSAQLAASVLSELDVPPSVVDEVVRLVRLTLTHDPAPQDAHGAVLSDADLAVLGTSEDRYAQYAQDVRQEYGSVDDEAFRAGRTQVLQTLVDRPRLYVTDTGHRRWDAAARRNLRAELSRLAAPPGATGAGRRP